MYTSVRVPSPRSDGDGRRYDVAFNTNFMFAKRWHVLYFFISSAFLVLIFFLIFVSPSLARSSRRVLQLASFSYNYYL